MFGLFKKRQQPPALPSKQQQFQVSFATTWIHTVLTSSIAGFSGAVLVGHGVKILTNTWMMAWLGSVPGEPMIEPKGLNVDAFRESDRLLVFITFPPSSASNAAYFGIVVLGPCDDPKWGAEACEKLPFRYFVLLRAPNGTTVEEWTTTPPRALGTGPAAEPALFAEWVINEAVRPAAGATVTVSGEDENVSAAITRARSELPGVLKRFLAGELQDGGFTVKVPVVEGSRTEHFWLSETTFSEGRFSGLVDAEPQVVSTIKTGYRVTASVEDVVDWMYARDRKMYGNYTLRALLPKMPPDQAAMYRAVLADEAG